MVGGSLRGKSDRIGQRPASAADEKLENLKKRELIDLVSCPPG